MFVVEDGIGSRAPVGTEAPGSREGPLRYAWAGPTRNKIYRVQDPIGKKIHPPEGASAFWAGQGESRLNHFNHQREGLMIPKYTVEYALKFRIDTPNSHYSTDDPVACEAFIEELLERQYHIAAIKHEGVPLSHAEFDRLIKNAAAMLASRHICASLHIKPEEERFRFGFVA